MSILGAHKTQQSCFGREAACLSINQTVDMSSLKLTSFVQCETDS